MSEWFSDGQGEFFQEFDKKPYYTKKKTTISFTQPHDEQQKEKERKKYVVQERICHFRHIDCINISCRIFLCGNGKREESECSQCRKASICFCGEQKSNSSHTTAHYP